MATTSLTGDAKAWYKAVKVSKKLLSWPVFIEEVLDFFAETKGNPIDEFKRIHQIGKVDEYAKKILRAKTRVIGKGHLAATEEFYVGCFVSGLKEDIRNTLDLFEPSTLKAAIKYARETEVVLNRSKKFSGPAKNQNYQQTNLMYPNQKVNRPNDVGVKRWSETSTEKPKNSGTGTNSMTIEEMRVKGLCFKCGDKYHIGHKCGKKFLHTMGIEGENEDDTAEVD